MLRAVFGASALLVLAGCEALTITALGVGAGTGVGHHVGGTVYKTFSEPLPKVKRATLVALRQMDIKISKIEKNGHGELIKAKAAEREIEIELEALTAKATRMRSVANDGVFKDAATATEIILQTEKALARA